MKTASYIVWVDDEEEPKAGKGYLVHWLSVSPQGNGCLCLCLCFSSPFFFLSCYSFVQLMASSVEVSMPKMVCHDDIWVTKPC